MQENLRRLLIMVAVNIVIMLINLDLTIVNLALARIASHFHSDLTNVQWVIISYGMAATIFFTLSGRLADRYGRRSVYMIGSWLFLLGSLGCGLSHAIHWLILFRFIQGLGFAATLALGLGIISVCYPPNRRGFAVGIAVTVVGFAQAIGPSIGGIILHFATWHWIFLMNIPFMLISIMMSYYLIPKQADHELNQQPISKRNLVLFVSAVIILFTTINELDHLTMGQFLLLFILGIGLLFWFLRASFYTKYPLIDVTLLSHKRFLQVLLIRFCTMIYMAALLFIIPLYMQNILQISPLHTGMAMLVMGLFIAICSPLSGRMTDRIGFRIPLMCASTTALLSAIFMLFLSAHITVFLIISLSVVFICYGLTLGLHLTPSISAAQQQAPKGSANAALGVFYTVALSGSSLGVAISGVLLTHFSQSLLCASLQHFPELLALIKPHWAELLQLANGSQSFVLFAHDITILSVGQKAQLQHLIHEAYFFGMHIVAAVLVLLSLFALILSYRLPIRSSN